MNTDPQKNTDPYPENIDYEINREGLTQYFLVDSRRVIRTLLWFIVGVCVFVPGISMLEGCTVYLQPWMVIPVMVLLGFAIHGLIVMLAVPISYLMKERARRTAMNLQVSVQGAYLRIRSGEGEELSDQLIHFRSLVDFSHIKNKKLDRIGVEMLNINTMAGGIGSEITILGLKDTASVRDQLAEIDALRENA